MVTAFIAALFGGRSNRISDCDQSKICYNNVLQGFVSPLISNGLAAMSQFEITLPQIRRINVTAAENGTENQSRMLHYLHLLNESDDV